MFMPMFRYAQPPPWMKRRAPLGDNRSFGMYMRTGTPSKSKFFTCKNETAPWNISQTKQNSLNEWRCAAHTYKLPSIYEQYRMVCVQRGYLHSSIWWRLRHQRVDHWPKHEEVIVPVAIAPVFQLSYKYRRAHVRKDCVRFNTLSATSRRRELELNFDRWKLKDWEVEDRSAPRDWRVRTLSRTRGEARARALAGGAASAGPRRLTRQPARPSPREPKTARRAKTWIETESAPLVRTEARVQ